MKKIYFATLGINTFFSMILLFLGGVLFTYVELYLPLGAKLVFPMFMAMVYIGEILLLIGGMISCIRAKKYRVMPIAVMSVVLFAALVFVPTTKFFSIVNYRINYDIRKEFVESLDSEIQNYPQINVDEYFIKDIRVSHSGSVRIYSADGATKVIFFPALPSRYKLIYSSDKSGVSDGDFSYGFNDKLRSKFKIIEKLDDYWCIAVFE